MRLLAMVLGVLGASKIWLHPSISVDNTTPGRPTMHTGWVALAVGALLYSFFLYPLPPPPPSLLLSTLLFKVNMYDDANEIKSSAAR
jgi:hypothetical protein